MPIAIITVMLCVPFIYTLIQCVCVGILGSDLAGAKLPLSAAFSKAVGQWGFTFIAIGALLSTGSYAIVLSFLIPRTLQALSSDGLMPRILEQNSRFEVPFGRVFAVIAVICSVYVMINADFTSFKKCLITFVLIAPFYFLAKRFCQKA